MASNFKEWYFQLVDMRTMLPIDDDTGVYNVLTENDPSEVTIYSDDSGSTGTNPGTMTDGVIRFWTDSATTIVDVSILTANGHAFFLESVTQSQHRVNVIPEVMTNTLIMPYQVVGASETVVDTGFDLSANMLVRDVYLHCTAAATGGVLDVGTSTDQDGLINASTISATGWWVIDEGLVSAPAIGELLLATLTNSHVRRKHVRANATSGANIVYSNLTVCSTAGEGYIYMTYDRLPA